MKTESLTMSQFWEEKLSAMPYVSCKYLLCLLNSPSFLLVQRKTARRSTCLSPSPSPRRANESGRRSRSSAPSTSTPSRRRSPCLPPAQSEATKCQARSRAGPPLSSTWLLRRLARTTLARAKTLRCLENDAEGPKSKVAPILKLHFLNCNANPSTYNSSSSLFSSFLKLVRYFCVLG